MRYCTNIELPFNLDLRSITIRDCNPLLLGHFSQRADALPGELISFLTERELSVSHVEIFHTPPNARLPIHADGPKLSNIVKLNWCYGGGFMNWFKLRDPTQEPPMKLTNIGTRYIQPSAEQCVMVHSAKINLPTLVNVGQLHSVINNEKISRWVLSVVLTFRNEPLEWNQAVKQFML